VTAHPTRGEIAGRGLFGGATGGAAIGGAFLATASRHVVGHDWCARRLAFTTSAAPFLLGLGIARAGFWWWLAGALISGLAGAVLAPWVVRGGSLDRRPAGPR
jgi:hypothetical protein